jgi:hypothetical protein
LVEDGDDIGMTTDLRHNLRLVDEATALDLAAPYLHSDVPVHPLVVIKKDLRKPGCVDLVNESMSGKPGRLHRAHGTLNATVRTSARMITELGSMMLRAA